MVKKIFTKLLNILFVNNMKTIFTVLVLMWLILLIIFIRQQETKTYTIINLGKVVDIDLDPKYGNNTFYMDSGVSVTTQRYYTEGENISLQISN